MSHESYTRLRYSLIGSVFLLLLAMLLISVLSTQPLMLLNKILTGLFCLAMASYFLANAACGIQHEKMWARGSPVTAQNSGRAFYWFHLPMNISFGIILGSFAVLAWTGLMKTGL